MEQAVLTLGMWVHVVLNALVSYRHTPNPIWGELRVAGVVLVTAAVWVILSMVVG
jgi:hypothetical protein